MALFAKKGFLLLKLKLMSGWLKLLNEFTLDKVYWLPNSLFLMPSTILDVFIWVGISAKWL